MRRKLFFAALILTSQHVVLGRAAQVNTSRPGGKGQTRAELRCLVLGRQVYLIKSGPMSLNTKDGCMHGLGRWFVMKQGKIFWFKSEVVTADSVPRGVIDVGMLAHPVFDTQMLL